jgi:hypothetical protein
MPHEMRSHEECVRLLVRRRSYSSSVYENTAVGTSYFWNG